MATKELQIFVSSYGYQLASCVCSVIFITLVSLDVWKAFQRKAHWIPGQAFVLSAFTIELLIFIDHFNVNINPESRSLKDAQLIVLVQDQLVFDCRRVMMCVFMAYLLPGMVSRCLRNVWGDVGALAAIVITHVAFEVYLLVKFSQWQFSGPTVSIDPHVIEASHSLTASWSKCKRYRAWLMPSYIALLSAIILLVVLLNCAVIAGESIRKMMSQRVQLALSCCCNANEYRKTCKNIEDHVLKSWIVVRISQPDYVMARSEFSAFAGVVVAVCVVALIVKWSRYVPLPHYPVDIAVYAIEFAFVVIGSIVVVFRWLTAVFNFPKDVRCLFQFEDFWTRNLVQQKKDLRASQLILSLLLTLLLWVQKLIVSLSKVSWFLSQFVFGMMIRPFTMNINQSDQFSKYEEVLEIMRMPGENADSMWRANESAFLKTENHFQKGNENGMSSSKELIKLIKHKTGSPKGEPPTFLDQEEKYFKDVANKSWMMRAVTLILFILYFYDGTSSDVVNDCIQAYSQALCFLDMVDSSDPEAKLVSQAAGTEFHTLENVWKKLRNMKQKKLKGATSNRLLDQKMKNPLKENMDHLSSEEK